MKTKLLALYLLSSSLALSAFSQNTVFTYQGKVTANGESFSGAGQFKFALVTSTNFSHTATATANLPSGGYITGYGVTASGSGYVIAPTVTLFGGGGSGAAAHANLSGGAVISITVDNPGNGGYTTTPTVSIAPPPPNISYTTFWSNDGLSVNGSEPASPVIVSVSNGLFTVPVGDVTQPNMAAIATSLFNQPNLQLRIWFNDGAHGSAALDPAQSLTPTPYAAFASVANTASNLVSLIVQQNTNGAPNVIGGSSFNYVSNGVVGATIAGGGTTNYNSGHSYTNRVTGDFGTVSGGKDNVADFGAFIGGGSLNIAGGSSSTIAGGDHNSANGDFATVGGGAGNFARSDYSTTSGGYLNNAYGLEATIGGGFSNFATNTCTTIGGGYANSAGGTNATVGGGFFNFAHGICSTVGGGVLNIAHDYATVAGGTNNAAFAESAVTGGSGNIASGYRTAIGGGFKNTASTDYSTIGGGQQNTASGLYSTIPGGFQNNASAISSFAAGYTAQAVHQGAFVWADYTAGSFSSAAANQFSVRATGGVRFVCNVAGTAGLQIAAGGSSWISVSDRNAKKNFAPVNAEIVLEKLTHIPVELWNYKWEADSDVPNIGPMAQDFKAAFYPGRDDKGISTLEFDGVELAAIQGLNAKLEAHRQKSEDKIQQLEAENAELKQRLEAVEKILLKQVATDVRRL